MMPDAPLVMVVEDNPANLRLLSMLLGKAGYSVCSANNAEEGIERIRALKPALILMDMQLPGMDGIAATKAMKADPQIRAIPVVAITAFAMKGDEQRMRAAGCDGYITKPIRYREFLVEVGRQIKHKGDRQ
jgi:two-component system, cell cycle response regulator DivK